MPYINTGIKRSLTIEITKESDGVILLSYPKTYNGQLEFTFNSVIYYTLTDNEFANLSEGDYLIRLDAFKAFVKLLEPSIDFTTDVISGYESSIQDSITCPPPVTTTTTTATTTTTSTTTTATPPPSLNIIVAYEGVAGITNGLDGIVNVCSQLFTINPYATNYVINTQINYNVPCVLDFTALLTRVNGNTVSKHTYYRNSNTSPWIDTNDTHLVYVTIPTGFPVFNIEVLVSAIVLTTTTTSTTTSTTTTTPPSLIQSLWVARPISGQTSGLCGRVINGTNVDFNTITALYFKGTSTVPKQYDKLYKSLSPDIEWHPGFPEYYWAAIIISSSNIYSLYDLYVTSNGIITQRPYICSGSDVTTTTTTVNGSTTTLAPFWYKLYRCENAQYYYVGPFFGPRQYGTGEKVQGATGVYYIVTTTVDVAPQSTITGITGTGSYGCI